MRSFVFLLLLLLLLQASSFVPSSDRALSRLPVAIYAALPTPEESAAALTDYMSRAHEEKIRAMASVEAKFKDRIKELEEKLEQQGESPTIQGGVKTESNSYLTPATNKSLIEKVQAYQKFLREYTVKVQKEKIEAVAAAEKKLTDKYEAIIDELNNKYEAITAELNNKGAT